MRKVFCLEIGVDCGYLIQVHTEDELDRHVEQHAFNRHEIGTAKLIPYFNVSIWPRSLV